MCLLCPARGNNVCLWFCVLTHGTNVYTVSCPREESVLVICVQGATCAFASCVDIKEQCVRKASVFTNNILYNSPPPCMYTTARVREQTRKPERNTHHHTTPQKARGRLNPKPETPNPPPCTPQGDGVLNYPRPTNTPCTWGAHEPTHLYMGALSEYGMHHSR